MNDLASFPSSTKAYPNTNPAKTPTSSFNNGNSTNAAQTTKTPGKKHSPKQANKTRQPRKAKRTPKTTTIRNAQTVKTN